MKSERLSCTILLLACLTLGSCSKQKAEIPVTTSSAEARQLFLQGRDLLDAARPADALPYFMQALEQDHDFALAQLGVAETAATDDERAAALERAIELGGRISLGERRMIFAVHARKAGDLTRRLEICREMVRMYPDDARARLLLGESYDALGNHVHAITSYTETIGLDPELSPVYRRLSDTYRSLGRYRQAEGALVKYVAMRSSDPNAHGFFADLIMKTGRFEESIEHYEKALALDPDFRTARVGIGNNLVFLERTEEAQAMFQELYDSAGGNGERMSALIWLAAAQLHQEDHERALAELDRAYELANQTDDAAALAAVLDLMGDVLLESGNADAALSRYTESAAILEDSDLPHATKQAARSNIVYHQTRIAIARGEFSTARSKLAEFRRSLRDGTADAKDRFNEMSGLIALAEGDREKAVLQLERASQRDPRISYSLALAYRDLGRDDEARRSCRHAADFNEPAIEFAFVRAKARRLLGEI